MTEAAPYTIRTPLREAGGLSYGGLLRIKTRLGPANVAVATRNLAADVIAHWAIAGEVHVEPWAEALRHEPAGSRAGYMMVFRDSDDFRTYLWDQAGYRPGDRLAKLGPAPVAVRTSAAGRR